MVIVTITFVRISYVVSLNKISIIIMDIHTISVPMSLTMLFVILLFLD